MTDVRANAGSESRESISFLLLSELRDFRFNRSRSEALEFFSDSPPLAISIRSKLPQGVQGGVLECRLSRTIEVEADLAEFIKGLSEYRYVRLKDSPISPPFYLSGEMRIADDGKLCRREQVPYDVYPTRLRELVDRMSRELLEDQQRFLRLLRWSQDGNSSHVLYEREPELYWGVTSQDYAPVARPQVGSDDRMLYWAIGWEPHHRELLAKLWPDKSSEEPVAHELLREAHALASYGSFRSALLMSATAVEVGAKDHISRHRPHTEWLMQNLPSPPIHKLLRHYLYEIHGEGPAKDYWDGLRNLWAKTQKLAEARNKIAHAGAKVDSDDVWSHLQTAHDVLYVLDVLDGHEWARTRVSSELQKALGWPSPPEIRLTWSWSPTRWLVDR